MATAQKFVPEKAERLGIKDPILAASVYTDDPDHEANQPTVSPWRHIIHLVCVQQTQMIRNDLVYISLQGALYRNDEGSLQFHGPREFSLIEKCDDDPDDVADPLVGEKVTMRIPCLEETMLHVSTTPDYFVPCDEFSAIYSDFWSGLHPDIRQEIENGQVNIYVNPARCMLNRKPTGWINERLITLYTPMFRFRAEYEATRLSSDTSGRYSRKQGFRVEVGFTGCREYGEVRRKGCFLYKIPPRGSSEKGTLIFLSGQLFAKEFSPAGKPSEGMITARHILYSYGMFMAGGGLIFMAHNHGLYLPTEPSAARSKKNRRYWANSRNAMCTFQIRAEWPQEQEEPEFGPVAPQEADEQTPQQDPENDQDPSEDTEGDEEPDQDDSDDEPCNFGTDLTEGTDPNPGENSPSQ